MGCDRKNDSFNTKFITSPANAQKPNQPLFRVKPPGTIGSAPRWDPGSYSLIGVATSCHSVRRPTEVQATPVLVAADADDVP